MTLSLDDVRNKRFRMARKSGYEVLEVDEFVDEVEVAFEQLTEENANLKKQIEALKATPAEPEQPAESDQAEQAPAEPETIVVTAGPEASSAVVRLVALSAEQAERLVEEANAEAENIRAEATASAEELTGDAQARAERISAEAQDRAANLDNEIAGRRSELLDALNVERDELQVAVGQLRSFEASFRANLTNELREHISSLESRNAQPYEVPPLADPAAIADAEQRASTSTGDAETSQPAADAAPAEAAEATAEATEATEDNGSVFPTDDPAAEESQTSETPRLDALLGDQR